MNRAAPTLIFLFLLSLAIQLGGSVYETLVVMPLWSNSPTENVQTMMEQSLQKRAGSSFWMFLTPAVLLLAIANFIASIKAPPSKARSWLLASVIVCFTYSAVTFVYFVPTLFKLFEASKFPSEDVQSMVTWWVRLHCVRLVALFGSFVCAAQAWRSFAAK